jgi:thiol-disulfide isomerase/thioredoxin
MNLVEVAAVLAGLVGVATLLGVLWRRQQGRVSHPSGHTVIRVSDLPGVRRFARGATLLQFSTEVCAPCKTTQTLLSEVASEHSDVTHIDVDVTHQPDLATQFRIMQTPTTLILDSRGVVRARIGGAPRRETVREELKRILIAA